MSKQAERLAMFRETSRDRLDRANLAWIQFEQGDLAQRDALLRELHTLKGEAGLLDLPAVADLAHAIEDAVLALETSDPVSGDLILRGLDMLDALINGNPPRAELEAVLQAFRASAHGPASGARDKAEAPAPAPAQADGKSMTSPRPAEVMRVTSKRLNQMRDMVGDLLLAQARFEQSGRELRRANELVREISRAHEAPGVQLLQQTLGGLEARIREDSHRVGRIVQELDATTRELRMVPLRPLFDPFPAAVRSIARNLGKEARVVIDEATIEVDRVLIEKLGEPLLHLIRNAVDHGLEAPADRVARGKPAQGTIELRARLRGHELEIDVIDDGAGINIARVRTRALELGILTAAQAEDASEQTVLSALFAPGMTTRTESSEISGRGVGLDIVQTTVQQLGGRIDLSSKAGKGTTFRLTVPISVAISSVLLFRVGTGTYGIPSMAVERIIDASAVEHQTGTEGPMARDHGEWHRLLSLPTLLGETGPAQTGGERLIAIRFGSERALLAGAHHLEERQVVQRPIGKLIPQRLAESVVVMVDGTAAMVLNPVELLSHSRAPAAAAPAPRRETGHGKTVLVVDDSSIIRDLVAEALRSHGVRVIEAADGDEALAKHDATIDLVVTDIEMPRRDGIGLIKELRAREATLKTKRTPIIVVSMRGSDRDKQNAIDAGADAYIIKSEFSHGGLWGAVMRCMR